MVRKRKTGQINALVEPIFQNAVFNFGSTDEAIAFHRGALEGGRYGRYDNPSWLEVESQIASLDGYEAALLFPSGMNAIAAAAMTFLSAGDRVIYTSLGYRNIRRLFDEVFSQLGVESVAIDQSNVSRFNEEFSRAYDDRVRMVFVEMPSNPHMYLVDLDHIVSEIDGSTLLVVDSTFSTPVNFRPKSHGADLVVHSATKYLGGHADLLAGTLAGDHELVQRVRERRNIVGSIPGAMTAFLLNRSLATLDLRMNYLNSSGQLLADFLESHDRVRRVLYTGQESHPHSALARKYLSGHGGVVSFEVDGSEGETSHFVDLTEIPYMGTNFGSQHTMIEQVGLYSYFHQSPEERARFGITDSLVRVSLGLDYIEDVIADIDQALSRTN